MFFPSFPLVHIDLVGLHLWHIPNLLEIIEFLVDDDVYGNNSGSISCYGN